MAGGFYVVLGNPAASHEAQAAGSVLTIKLAGCHEPEKAAVSAAAIGDQSGHRQSIPLKLTPLKETGTYSVTQQWPGTGTWVLEFIAKDGERVTSTLVAAGPSGVRRDKSKMLMSTPAERDIEALLAENSAVSAAR